MRRQSDWALVGLAAWLLLPGRVHGEITGIEVVEATHPGMPGFLFAYDLYVTFTDPGDGVVAVVGLVGDPLRFETNVVSGFHQEFLFDGDQDLSVNSEVLSAWPSLALLQTMNTSQLSFPSQILDGGNAVTSLA